jgi:uncharacterized oligopeptide transporter (OPT) family protein
MSAFGVAFIGNTWALVMFGIGLLLRGYSPRLFADLLPGGDFGKAFIPHCIMIGAGLVALIQVVMVITTRHKEAAGVAAHCGPICRRACCSRS